jgi:hypothetical protein
VTILEAVADPQLFRRWFRDPASWAAWRAFLAALFGLPMSEDQRAVYTACTGRSVPPAEPFNEAWLVCGRRSGKSFVVALTAVFLAAFKDWMPYLAPGERGTILILASDRRQARTIMRYVSALLHEVELLAPLVQRVTAEEIELGNRVSIEITTASFRSVRGYTVLAACCDEVAFWYSHETSANPDNEILDALRPAMATVPGAMLLCASSPYARKGALWEAYRRWHGRDGAPVLVWRAPSEVMNPTIPRRVIEAAYERDPAWAGAEYGAEFRSDIDAFVAREVVDQCTVPGRFELPRIGGNRYTAFVDPSGGSADSFTLAVAHRERDGQTTRAVLDCVREVKPPFSPETVVEEFCALLKSYGVARVTGDRYAGEWPRERFRKHGVNYDLSDRPASDIFRDALPLLNSGRIELLDHPKLAAQLVNLERRTARSGRDAISHPPGGHDDLAVAACGALLAASAGSSSFERFAVFALSDAEMAEWRAGRGPYAHRS